MQWACIPKLPLFLGPGPHGAFLRTDPLGTWHEPKPPLQAMPSGAGDRLILTVRAESSGLGQTQLICTTMGGNVAATLEWPIDAPASGLPQAIVAAVTSSGFDCPIKPLGVWHLRLIGLDGAKLALAEGSAGQFGPEPTSAPASSGAPQLQRAAAGSRAVGRCELI